MAQAFDPGAFEEASFEAAAGAPSPQTLLPALFTNAQAFYAPTVGRGAVTLAPDRLTLTNTFYAPTVVLGPISLSPPLYGNLQTFYAPTVGRGAIALTATRLDNTQAFYGAFITQGGPAQTLLPARLDNAQTFYGPTVVALAPILRPPLLTNTQTFYGPQINQRIYMLDYVDPGWVEPGWVGWPYFNVNQFFGPAASPGAVTLQATRLDNSQLFFTPFVGDAPQASAARAVSGGMMGNMGTLMNR